MASVSLCMIVKNEEAVLERCLSGAVEFADEIIVADTGSADRTREIAASFSDKVKVYEFPWQDDFAAARNFAFSKGKGDYLFWLDADDVIPEASRQKLLELKARLDEEQPDVVMMKYAVGFGADGKPDFVFYRERLIRRGPGARWAGRIHEAVAPFGKVVKEDILIEHRKMGAGDPDRNLRIFEEMIRDGEAFGARELYYYGKELFYHRRFGDALRALGEFLGRADGWSVDKIDAARCAAACHTALGDGEAALDALLSGLRYGILRPELHCDIGKWFFERARYREAAAWYRLALENAAFSGSDGFIQEELRGFVPALQLCVCHDRLGEREIAEKYNELAERLKPGDSVCARNREYFRGKRNGTKMDVQHTIS